MSNDPSISSSEESSNSISETLITCSRTSSAVYNFWPVKWGITVAFAIGVDYEIHDIKVEQFSREFDSERLRREACLVSGWNDPSKSVDWTLSVDDVGPRRQYKQKSGRSSGWRMKLLTFSTLSLVKTALRTSLPVRLFPKNKSNFETISSIWGTFRAYLFSCNC